MRLRTGLLVITMLLTLFGARLFQLQGVDSSAYASRADASGLVTSTCRPSAGRSWTATACRSPSPSQA